MRRARTGIVSSIGLLLGCGIFAVASLELPVTAGAATTPAAGVTAPAYHTVAVVQGDNGGHHHHGHHHHHHGFHRF